MIEITSRHGAGAADRLVPNAKEAVGLFMAHLADISSRVMIEMDSPVDVAAVIVWENEFLEPENQHNPDFYRNVLADGIEIRAIRDS